jgi:carbamate kinase
VRIVVGLGGAAVLDRDRPMTADGQRAAVAAASAYLAPLAEVHELVITHGSGPQAGLLSLQAPPHDARSSDPSAVLTAQTEGMVGYLIEQELATLLPSDVPVVTVLPMAEVEPDDAASADPAVFVGPAYTAGPARRIAEQRGWVFRRDGAAWRRVVPSPQPRRIVELRPVEWLLARGCVVLCAAGGGIPTANPRGTRTRVGVDVVVDGDRTSAVLAQGLGADLLVLASDVDAVYLGWGTPDRRAIARAHPDALDPALFPPWSMAPKVQAAAHFARTSGQSAVIGSLDQLPAMLAGAGGTRITLEAAGVQVR